MTKIARRSYWFEFKLDLKYSSTIHQQIVRAAPQAAQWCTLGDSVKGYLYFQHHRVLPLKKQWITCAEFTPSTSEQILSTYKYITTTFIGFGSNLLFSTEHSGDIKEKHPFAVDNTDDLPADSDCGASQYASKFDAFVASQPKKSTPEFKPFTLSVAGWSIRQAHVAILLLDNAAQEAALTAMSFSERELFMSDFQIVQKNYQAYLLALIKAQMN